MQAIATPLWGDRWHRGKINRATAKTYVVVLAAMITGLLSG